MKVEIKSSQSRRPYRMKARAASAEATEERILEAAVQLFGTYSYDQVSLQAIASMAQVTLQTVIRRFGSKESLFKAASHDALEEAFRDRSQVLSGDIESAAEKLVDHYEKWGNLILRLLGQEQLIVEISEATETGRSLHHQWVEHTFLPMLDNLPSVRSQYIVAQVIAVTDVHVWKTLRHDLGFSQEETRRAFIEIITPLVSASMRFEAR